jgi:hypothetical protein
LESEGSGEKCSTKFTGGTYYQKKALDQALKKRMRKATGSTLKFKASEVSQFRSTSPTIAKTIFPPIIAGAIGYVAPLWFVFESGVSLSPIVGGAAALGTLIPATLLAAPAVSKVQRLNRMTGADMLFEKLYCLSRRKTCGGEPCFKVCRNAEKNMVLVPYKKEPEGVIRC